MRIILSAIHDPLLKAWREHCADLEGVVVHGGSILDLECDAIVSPANSFGFMDAGAPIGWPRSGTADVSDFGKGGSNSTETLCYPTTYY